MSNKTNILNVTDIDYDDIRTSLIEFLRSQDDFSDYDFEGSGLATLISMLSYVTHFNAVNANIGINEAFLTTAQFRGSVVNHAQTLGYEPRSAFAPRALVNITVNPSVETTEFTIQRGHRFRTNLRGVGYTFVTIKDYFSSDGFFEGVELYEGSIQSVSYVFDSRSKEKMLIPQRNVDTSTIRVVVFDGPNVSTFTEFKKAREITSIKPDSNVYYLSENPDGRFEVYFGDGILGKELENGNIVRIDYVVTSQDEANGARVFTTSQNIAGTFNVSIETVSPARGGSDKESVDSVRRNAPLLFASQNRAVTPNDFEAIIRSNFANIEAIRVWGGEDNDPPVYGKVYISILPKDTDFLTIAEKQTIENDILQPKKVATITPEIVDSKFLYLVLEVFFKYDPTITNLTETELKSKVLETILDFNRTELRGFGRVFRYSNLVSAIDSVDDAILNTTARVFLQKRFIPVLNIPRRYVLDYSTPLLKEALRPIIERCTEFQVDGIGGCRFKDRRKDSGRITIDIVKGFGPSERIIKRNVGFIEGTKITIENFAPQNFDGENVVIEVVPDSNDIYTTLNNVLTIDCNCPEFRIFGEVDQIAAGRNFSGINYSTTSRLRPPREP